MNTNTVYNDMDCSLLSQISWRAILGGIVIGLVAEILLNLLGVGFGLTAFDVDTNRLVTISTASTIWFVVAGVISMFLSGWFAGHLSGLRHNLNGVIHGLMTWASITLIICALMASTVGSIIGGSVTLLGQGLTAASNATKLVNEQNLQKGEKAEVMARENAAPDLVTMVNQQIAQSKQKAVETAKKATDVLGMLAVVTFFVLMLGALSALLGGILGVRTSKNVNYPARHVAADLQTR